jgi:hypothetical protein
VQASPFRPVPARRHPAEPSVQPAAAPLVRNDAQLCTVLAAVMATESEGFARLRSGRLAAERWLGRELSAAPSKAKRGPGARYVCVGPRLGAEGRDHAELAFDALARELEQCLEKPIWFPRDWERGERFEFAMGERLQARTSAPRSQVVPKVQQDAAGQAYRVKLDLAAVP